MLKRKTNIFVTILFTFVAFMLIGTTNVNAVTADPSIRFVYDEDALIAALDGIAEDDSGIVTDTVTAKVILEADITLTKDLIINAITDLTLDLNGHTIDGETKSKNVYIYYGGNSIETFTTGSLTIKDTSESQAGTIKSYETIGIFGSNYNDVDKHFALTIENGKFYVLNSQRMFELSSNDYYMKNTTFDFLVKDGYFENVGSYAIFLNTNDTVKNNVTLNVKYEKLTFKNNSVSPRLISIDIDKKVEDVVSEDSNIKLKYITDTKNEEAELIDRTLSAKTWNAFASVIQDYNIIEITKKDGFDVSDVTLNATYGYETEPSQGIEIKNRGANALKVQNVSVDDTDKFEIVPVSAQPTLAAGASDSASYTIKAKTGLNAGTYTATITVTDVNDKTLQFTAIKQKAP